MSLVLGVDVGSQSIKVVLVDEGGDVVASGSAALSMTHRHDGWAEQDPHTYCTALRDAVRAATAGIEPTRVVATRSVQAGLGAMVAFEPSLSAEENVVGMEEAAAGPIA